jgi:putative FmdB family regulatory protein
MPFYEYECSNCKFYVETLQKISDEPLKKCPSCKKQTMKKLISAPVFRLKGAGWYETDFKSEGEDKRNIADRDEPADTAEASKPAADSSDTKVEKPDKKAEKAEKAESKAEVKTAAGKKAPAKGAPAKAAAAKGKKPAAKAPVKRPPPKKAAPAKKKAKRR